MIVAPTAVASERYRGLLMGDMMALALALAVALTASSRCAPVS